jgi:hypothetical protein
LVAFTLKVYSVFAERPEIAHVTVGGVVVHVLLPGADVTVYPVIAEPPLFAGAVHEIVAVAPDRDADALVGASGFTGSWNVVPVESALVPNPLVARTVAV